MTDYNCSAVVALLFLGTQRRGNSDWHGQSNYLHQAWTGRHTLAFTFPYDGTSWNESTDQVFSFSLQLWKYNWKLQSVWNNKLHLNMDFSDYSSGTAGLNNIYLRYKFSPSYSGSFCYIIPALHRWMSCCSRPENDHSPLNCSSTCNSVDSNFLSSWFSFSFFPSRGKGPLKNSSDVINAAKKIAEAGSRMDKLARAVADQVAPHHRRHSSAPVTTHSMACPPLSDQPEQSALWFGASGHGTSKTYNVANWWAAAAGAAGRVDS